MFQLHTTEIANVLQAAIAPAFLIAGIGTFISVMTQRLARVVDRARELEREMELDDGDSPHARTRAGVREKLQDVLVERARLSGRAIAFSTGAAIAICVLIALQFADAMVQVDLSGPVGLMFVVAMMSMVSGLVTFLREVFLSTTVLRKAYLRVDRRPLRKAA